MIRFEYEIPTSGVRVSFVIRDGLKGFPDLPTLFTDMESRDNGVMTCPDTPDNLEAIKQLVDFEKDNS
jgi:hypothetical protein